MSGSKSLLPLFIFFFNFEFYLSLTTRLSPEKNPMLFANAAGLLCAQLQKAGVVPMLLGAGTTAYARDVHARLRQGCPHGSPLAL